MRGEVEARDLVLYDYGGHYEGEWLVGTDIRQGHGIYVWPHGSQYSGQWKNNKMEGYGVFTW